MLRYFEDDPELTREERLLASALLRTCAWCAALGPETSLIADATRAMSVPPAGRDFRITPRQARRARTFDLATLGQRFRAALTMEAVRPIAGVAVAVGLVLAVIGGVPYFGHSGGAPATAGKTASATTAAGGSIAPEAAAASTPNPDATEMSPFAHTGPSETSTAGFDTSAETPPPPAPSSLGISNLRVTATPSEAPQIAVLGTSGPSPEPGANPAAGALPTQPRQASTDNGALPPLLIFGVLLAFVGLLVGGLSVVAGRMENAAR